MNTNANNTGTNNSNSNKTASQKRFNVVEIFGNKITENVLMSIPPATNKFLRNIAEKTLPNGFRMKAHRKIGKKIHSSNNDQTVIMNFHYYGFEDNHLGKQMVCKLKLVKVTREDGKSFLSADVYRQPAGTDAKWIFTISNDGDKGILILGTNARILLKKAQPRPVKAEAGTATAPETLTKDTVVSTPEAPVTETASPEIASGTDTGKKSKKREYRDKAPKQPRKKGSRLAKYEFQDVPADKKPARVRKEKKNDGQETDGQKQSSGGYYAKEEPKTVDEALAAGFTIDKDASNGRMVVLKKDGASLTRFLPKTKKRK